MTFRFKNAGLIATVALLAVPVGSVLGDESHNDQHHSGAEQIGMPGDSAAVSRTIEISMSDNYFEPEKIAVAQGETVRFIVRNTGAFVHEFNIGTAEMHVQHQEEMMMMFEHGMLEADRINHEMMSMDMGEGQTMTHDDPNTVLLEPGETAEIVWSFTGSGTLEFACNVPGHYDAGMYGDIVVEQGDQQLGLNDSDATTSVE